MLLLLALAALAESGPGGAPFDACAAEAASQFETGFEAIGRDTWDIDTDAAIAACTKALEAEPDATQLKGWLARAYFAAGDTAEAVPLFEEAAAEGHVLALAILGDMLTTGDGIEQDMERGAHLLTEGAEAGFALAQNSLGLSYDFGEGLAQDYTQAARWYRAAAEQGMSKAQSNLGLMYQEGLGVPRDYVAAAAWFELAVAQGDASGQVNLGKLLQDGLGQPADPARAAELYQLAADQGDMYGQNNLGFLKENGLGVEEDVPAAASSTSLQPIRDWRWPSTIWRCSMKIDGPSRTTQQARTNTREYLPNVVTGSASILTKLGVNDGGLS